MCCTTAMLNAFFHCYSGGKASVFNDLKNRESCACMKRQKKVKTEGNSKNPGNHYLLSHALK